MAPRCAAANLNHDERLVIALVSDLDHAWACQRSAPPGCESGLLRGIELVFHNEDDRAGRRSTAGSCSGCAAPAQGVKPCWMWCWSAVRSASGSSRLPPASIAFAVAACAAPSGTGNSNGCGAGPFAVAPHHPYVRLASCSGEIGASPLPGLTVKAGTTVTLKGLSSSNYSDPTTTAPSVLALGHLTASSADLHADEPGRATVMLNSRLCLPRGAHGHCSVLTVTGTS